MYCRRLRSHHGIRDAHQYAKQVFSDEGQHNGLYWKISDGEPQSPIGPLVASAVAEGYVKDRLLPSELLRAGGEQEEKSACLHYRLCPVHNATSCWSPAADRRPSGVVADRKQGGWVEAGILPTELLPLGRCLRVA